MPGKLHHLPDELAPRRRPPKGITFKRAQELYEKILEGSTIGRDPEMERLLEALEQQETRRRDQPPIPLKK